MIVRLLIAISALATVAAAPAERPALGPVEAIAAVDKAGNHGITRTVEFTVRSAHSTRSGTFLNSERDYRDPGNLSVLMTPAVAQHLARRLGRAPQTYLIGKAIVVNGYLVRVPIHKVVAGQATPEGYYQHRVLVRRSDDVTVK